MISSTKTLWSIHIPGPDDYHAAPSEKSAIHMAEKHNASMTEHFSKTPITPGDDEKLRASCNAVVSHWPFDAEAHAKAISDFDYAAWGLAKGDES